MYLHSVTFELVVIADESPLPWSCSQSTQGDRQQTNDGRAKNGNRVLTQVES